MFLKVSLSLYKARKEVVGLYLRRLVRLGIDDRRTLLDIQKDC